MTKSFWISSLLLFCSYRAADIVNLIISFLIVPRYINREDLGAVLPLTTLATFISLPIFAFAMTAMKEGAELSAKQKSGQLKSLYCGVFTVFAVFITVQPLIIGFCLPDCLTAMRVDDVTVGFLAATAAVLGCTAPIYMDALQSRKRFAALGTVEIISSLARLLTMLIIMPVKAMAGFFAGNAVQPLARIIASIFAFRRELSIPAEKYWTKDTSLRIARNFFFIAVYQALPMLACLTEQSVLRINLPESDSAGYYMASRLSDLLNYLTLPLMLVMFPYTASAAADGKSYAPFVRKTSLITLAAAAILCLLFAGCGEAILSLLSGAGNYAQYARYSPWLVIITALNACQTFHTNSEVSAGRFGFLAWFAPLNLIYAATLWHVRSGIGSLEEILGWMSAVSLLRFILSRPTAH